MPELSAATLAGLLETLLAPAGLRRVTRGRVSPTVLGAVYRRDYPRLVLGAAGLGRYRVAGPGGSGVETLELARGDLAYLPAGAPIQPLFTEPYQSLGLLWTASPQVLYATRVERAADGSLRVRKAAPVTVTLETPAVRAMLAVLDALDERPPTAPALLHLTRGLLALLQERLAGPAAGRGAAADPARVGRGKAERGYDLIRAIVDEHVAEPLTRASVARLCRMHPNNVTRLCQRFAGRPFVDLLRETRLRNARSLLQAGELSVAAVAERCGFSTAGYLARCYRAAYGRSPSQERARHSGD